MFKKVDTLTEQPKQVVKMGGYHYWNWKFPFYHLKKEVIYIMTETGVYTWDIDKKTHG